jgi:hypothetical protein
VEVGKTYLIKHQRKGTFMAKILSENGDFTDALIVAGQADAILAHNIAAAGDPITFRTSFVISATPQPES